MVRATRFAGVPLLGPVRVFTLGATLEPEYVITYVTTAGNRAVTNQQGPAKRRPPGGSR